MEDSDKVRKGLECCEQADIDVVCPDDCPYYHLIDCRSTLIRDAQEFFRGAVPNKVITIGRYKIGYCHSCGKEIDNLINPAACGYCGKPVMWA